MYLFESGSTDAFFCPLTGLVVDLDVYLLDENLTGLVGAVDLGRLIMEWNGIGNEEDVPPVLPGPQNNLPVRKTRPPQAGELGGYFCAIESESQPKQCSAPENT